MRISDWSSDVCSSDLGSFRGFLDQTSPCFMGCPLCLNPVAWWLSLHQLGHFQNPPQMAQGRSEEHTSELQSLMRISYAVFCLKNTKKQSIKSTHQTCH